MFGSIGFKVNGKLCLGVGDHDDHQLMVRVGPNAYSDALKQPGAHPAIMREREMKGYVFVTGDGLTKEGSLEYWVKLAVTFNTQLTKQDAQYVTLLIISKNKFDI